MNPIVDIGAYRFCIENSPKHVVNFLHEMYDDSVNLSLSKPVDFFLNIQHTSFVRRFLKPQVCLYIDNQRPFNPVNPRLLVPSIEWGMNWCIASMDHSKLLIHASVLVKDGKAILFPATPGSGKSTLATYFGLRGWQLFSDEMAVIQPDTNTVVPVHRPASLKNRSIDIIKRFNPEATFSETTLGTHKGDIAHVKVQTRAEFNRLSEAEITAVVFPKFDPNLALTIEHLSQVDGFSKLVHHSFNYSVLGEQGFSTLQKVVDNCRFFAASYSSYSGVDSFLDDLVSR